MVSLNSGQATLTVPPLPPSTTLMYDLPSDFPEEPGLPDEFHDLQPQWLSRTLHLTQYGADNYFTGTDINLYYDVRNPLWHKRPDCFLAVNVPKLYSGKDLRNSYVVWQEGVSPLVVVEFLSPGTEAGIEDRFIGMGSLLKLSKSRMVSLRHRENGRCMSRFRECLTMWCLAATQAWLGSFVWQVHGMRSRLCKPLSRSYGYRS